MIEKLTSGEEDDGLHTSVFSWVHLKAFQFLHLFLKDPDVIHERHHFVGWHRISLQARGCKQGSHVQRHVALGGIEDKQLRPAQPQQSYLIRHLEIRKAGDALGPLDSAEQQPGGKLANVVDANHVGRLHLTIARSWIGLGSHQKGRVGRQVWWRGLRNSWWPSGIPSGWRPNNPWHGREPEAMNHGLWSSWNSAPLNGCKEREK